MRKLFSFVLLFTLFIFNESLANPLILLSGSPPVSSPSIPAATAHYLLENNVNSETGHNATAAAGFSYDSTIQIQGSYDGLYDSNSDYFYVADHADFEPGAGDWSFSIWFRAGYLGEKIALLGKIGWVDGRGGYAITFDDADSYQLHFENHSSGTQTTIDTNWVPTVDTWYHAVFAFDADAGNELQVWVSSAAGTFGDQINGTQYNVDVAPEDTAAAWVVGHSDVDIDMIPFYGAMDDVRWWKGTTLNATQAQALYDLY